MHEDVPESRDGAEPSGELPGQGSTPELPRIGAARKRTSNLRELGHVVAVAGERVALSRRGLPEISRNHTNAVPKHAVVQKRRGGVEDDQIHAALSERCHQVRGELRGISVAFGRDRAGPDEDRNVHVAVGRRSTHGAGSEEVRLENLRSRLERGPEPLDQLPSPLVVHLSRMSARPQVGKSQAHFEPDRRPCADIWLTPRARVLPIRLRPGPATLPLVTDGQARSPETERALATAVHAWPAAELGHARHQVDDPIVGDAALMARREPPAASPDSYAVE